jgi:hypothetical protein
MLRRNGQAGAVRIMLVGSLEIWPGGQRSKI